MRPGMSWVKLYFAEITSLFVRDLVPRKREYSVSKRVFSNLLVAVHHVKSMNSSSAMLYTSA